jgi:hypothetical protein
MMQTLLAAVILTIAIPAMAQNADPTAPRDWANATTGRRIYGTLVRATNANVVVQRPSGSRVTIPRADLCKRDKEFLENLPDAKVFPTLAEKDIHIGSRGRLALPFVLSTIIDEDSSLITVTFPYYDGESHKKLLLHGWRTTGYADDDAVKSFPMEVVGTEKHGCRTYYVVQPIDTADDSTKPRDSDKRKK